MKLKARQIVPGWPRGRSTSSRSLPQVQDLDMWMFGRSNWCPADGYDLRWDIAYTIDYHRKQQAMVDKYLHEPMERAVDAVRLAQAKLIPVRHERHLPREWGNPEGIEVVTLHKLAIYYGNFILKDVMRPSPVFKKLVGRTA